MYVKPVFLSIIGAIGARGIVAVVCEALQMTQMIVYPRIIESFVLRKSREIGKMDFCPQGTNNFKILQCDFKHQRKTPLTKGLRNVWL